MYCPTLQGGWQQIHDILHEWEMCCRIDWLDHVELLQGEGKASSQLPVRLFQ
jgi:hypothetical protein